MTHDELVTRAVLWLRKAKKCRVVVWRPNVLTYEQPDAMGWTAGAVSFVAECKASRSDFLRDADKAFRRFPSLGMGVYRFYFTPPGLLKESDVPEGWGLAECLPKKVRVVRDAPAHVERNLRSEVAQLVRHGTMWKPDDDAKAVFLGSHI